MIHYPLALTLWLVGVGSCFADVVLHVSPRGRDLWPGTEQQPLRTLARARDGLRAMRRDRTEGATVWVHEGDYHLKAAFE